MNKIEEYIKEIISDSDSDIVGIDRDDIDAFKKGCDTIDGAKIQGTTTSIYNTLSKTLSDIVKRNEPNKCEGIILSIKTSETYDLTMEEVSDILDALTKHNPDVDIIWSLATKSSLQAEELELILLVGFEPAEKRIFQSFLNNLKKISDISKKKEGKLTNDDFASIGESPETQKLIKELCDEIDEDYENRRELSQAKDMEEWFDKKCDETLDDLAKSGIIDQPTENYYKTNRLAQKEAMERDILDSSKRLVNDLNGVDEVETNENNKGE